MNSKEYMDEARGQAAKTKVPAKPEAKPAAPAPSPEAKAPDYRYIGKPTQRVDGREVVKPGEVTGMMLVVDMFPTLAGLGGAGLTKGKPLDGLNVWSAISEGKPSPRNEVVYNVEPFRAGLREGDWKLIWRTPLPSALELYNIPQDPSEKNNLADKNPQKVAELQKRVEQLAKESAKALFLIDAFAAVKSGSYGEPSLPSEDGFFTQGD